MSRPALRFAIPGDPHQLTGGYLYDRHLAAGLGTLGWDVAPLRLDGSFPQPTSEALASAAAAYAALPDDALVLADGLAFAAMPDIASREASRLRIVALIHHPLGYEAGLDAATARTLVEAERRALEASRGVLVTSPTTRDTLVRDFGVPGAAIEVALPGTERAPPARGSGKAETAILAVGSIIPRKGFADLVRALAPLAGLPWRLAIVGSLDRSAAATAELRREIDAAGLGSRVTLLGERNDGELAGLYDRADLFVSAASYEGYGMALAEALAHGLPIVAVAGGAVGDWLDRGASILTPPGDGAALTAALRTAVGDPDRRALLRSGALAARERLPGWADTATRADRLLRRVMAL